MYQIVYLKYRESGRPREFFLERNNQPRPELEQLLLGEGYCPFYKNCNYFKSHEKPQYYYNFKTGIEAWIFKNEQNFKYWHGERIECPIVDNDKDF